MMETYYLKPAVKSNESNCFVKNMDFITKVAPADDLCVFLKYLNESYIDWLASVLTEHCKNEGHVWDNPKGQYTCENEGGTWREPREDVFCDQGCYIGGEDVEYYVRKCTRCGKVEKRQAVVSVQTPFKVEN